MNDETDYDQFCELVGRDETIIEAQNKVWNTWASSNPDEKRYTQFIEECIISLAEVVLNDNGK